MDFLDTWSKECRICSPKFFNRYFHLSVPINEISQKEIDYILSVSNNSQKFAEVLLELEKDKILDFLDKFENYTKERVPIENIESIIISFMDIADILPEYPKGLFDVLDTSMRVIRIFKQLLDRIENKEKRFMILEKAIVNSNRSLHIICEELSIRYEVLKKKTTMTEQTLDTEQLEKLKELACIKIKNWIDSNNFFKIKNLPYVLYRWKEWCNENKVIEEIKSIIIEDSNLIKFIGSFVSMQTSYGGGDYVGSQTKVIAFKEISDFIDMSIIVPRIKNIFTSNNFENLNAEEKEIIKLFLNEANKYSEQDLK
jgi:predicted KAP-like P-loop ATPase